MGAHERLPQLWTDYGEITGTPYFKILVPLKKGGWKPIAWHLCKRTAEEDLKWIRQEFLEKKTRPTLTEAQTQ